MWLVRRAEPTPLDAVGAPPPFVDTTTNIYYQCIPHRGGEGWAESMWDEPRRNARPTLEVCCETDTNWAAGTSIYRPGPVGLSQVHPLRVQRRAACSSSNEGQGKRWRTSAFTRPSPSGAAGAGSQIASGSNLLQVIRDEIPDPRTDTPDGGILLAAPFTRSSSPSTSQWI